MRARLTSSSSRAAVPMARLKPSCVAGRPRLRASDFSLATSSTMTHWAIRSWVMAVMLAWLSPVAAARAVRESGPCTRKAPSTRPRFCRRTLSLSLTFRPKQPTPHLKTQHIIPRPIAQTVFISGCEIDVDSLGALVPILFSSSEINAQGAGGGSPLGLNHRHECGQEDWPTREDEDEQVSNGLAMHDCHFRRGRC